MKYVIISCVLVLVVVLGITFFAPSLLPERSYGTISGSIMDKDGTTLGYGNIRVTSWPFTYYRFMGLSDLAVYTLEVPAGIYSVSAAASDLKNQTKVVSVLPRQKVRLDFNLEREKH